MLSPFVTKDVVFWQNFALYICCSGINYTTQARKINLPDQQRSEEKEKDF